MKNIIYFFGHRSVIFFLLMINILGTLYGYWWYKDQLAITPARFYIFVPDSPTASLFFVLVLIMYLFKKNWPLMEAFASITLIKYGLWAVAMNIGAGLAGTPLVFEHYLLIFSHLGMAVQALIYIPYYRIKPLHLVVVSVWTLHNDVIDYVFLMHPTVARSLGQYIQQIGYFTFWLSIGSIGIIYYLNVRNNSFKAPLL